MRLIAILLTALALAPAGAPAGAPPPRDLVVKGLQQRVTVRRDARGIPYIEAASAHDLFFAQGYVTAADRLWQMDLLRRTARGELAEVLGGDLVEQDFQMRLFGFGRLADGLVERVPARMREALSAYADGVNAFILSRGVADLPVEFGILGYAPKPWRPADSLLAGKLFALDLTTTWQTDLMRASFADLPPQRRAALLPEQSPLDVVLLGAERPAKAATTSSGAAGLNAARTALARTRLRAGALAASNNWVVSGARSVTGKPLLANDPHLPPSAPSIWYLAHLSAPGFRVAGVTAPGAIGVLIGHNERIAWGVTNLMADVQDLYAESFDAAGSYAAPGGQLRPQARSETILVRSGKAGAAPDPTTREVVTTRHGPIVLDAGGRRYALRWTSLDPDACELAAFFDIDTASDWKEFTSALRSFPGPPLNFVYADVAGHVGWYAAGRIPMRRSGDGSVPSDGTTDEGAWAGYVPFDELPHLLDPPSGVIVTANNRVVGAGYPHLITRAWNVPYRARRIADLLAAKPKLSAEDFQSIQADTYAYADVAFARAVVEVARVATTPRPEWTAMLQAFDGWDGRAAADSRVLPLAAAMRRAFAGKVLRSALGEERAKEYDWPNRDTFIDELVTKRPDGWLPRGYDSWPALLLDCWNEARASLAGRAGTDETQWTWGRVGQPVTFPHPLAALPGAGARFAIEPLPNAANGSGETVNAGSYVSMRFIADPSDWDRSRQGIAPGESGDPSSPHWRDQLEGWRAVATPAFPFSPSAVTRAAVETLILLPEGPPPERGGPSAPPR